MMISRLWFLDICRRDSDNNGCHTSTAALLGMTLLFYGIDGLLLTPFWFYYILQSFMRRGLFCFNGTDQVSGNLTKIGDATIAFLHRFEHVTRH